MEHLAVIMDGNGRWAVRQGKPRAYGYEFGAKAFSRLVEDFFTLPISVLTVYAFSTENNTRNKEEVSNINHVIASFLLREIFPICVRADATLRFIGDREGLAPEVAEAVKRTERTGKGKTVVVALNYGGIDEVCRTYRNLLAKNVENVTKQTLFDALDTAGLPPVDAVIRYGGHRRLSNFLPLQTAYAELFFTEKFFPDYDRKDVENVLEEFGKIKRTFGGDNA